MILTAGLTPAWQQIVVLDDLNPGEVNRAREVHWCASGKVLNVALACHHLQGEVKALTLLGGRNGAAIRDEFDHRKIPARFLPARAQTRVCTTLLDTRQETTTEIVQNSAPLEPSELRDFQTAFLEEASHASVIVLTGSLPAGTPPTFYGDLIAQVRSPVILDIRGPELRQALPMRPLVVKPNREELAQTIGGSLMNDKDVFQAMAQLNGQGAEWVLVTNGGGPMLISGPGQQFRLQPPAAARVVNPIGCGDCLAAGLALSVAEGKPMADAFRFGMAAAVENVSHLLPGRVDRSAVEQLAQSLGSQG